MGLEVQRVVRPEMRITKIYISENNIQSKQGSIQKTWETWKEKSGNLKQS